jgi:uncharacterized protein (DUF885 family)
VTDVIPPAARELADTLLDISLDADPLGASLLEIPGYDDRLPDPTAAAEQRHAARLDDLAKRAREVLATGQLEGEQRVTATFVEAVATTERDVAQAGLADFAISDLWVSPVAGALEALRQIPLGSVERAEGYLARLRAFPGFVDAVLDRFRAGLGRGRTPVAVLVENALGWLDRLLADPALAPMQLLPPPDWPGAPPFVSDRDRLLAEVVRPTLARYREALAAEFRAPARPQERPGLGWLPDGAAAYAACVRSSTSTSRTPEDLHQTGLEVIAGLRDEYATIGADVFGSIGERELFERLRSDPGLRFGRGQEMVDASTAAIERAEARAAEWFGRLPAGRCAVEPVPEDQAPTAPFAYYFPPGLDGGRPGTFFINTFHPQERFRHQIEATSFHEGVPGHHFQISLAQQLTDLPTAQRVLGPNAYVEGWGLYAERLADEMGLYTDGVARLGMLTADSMRAGRLVVDTGLHAMGWSRQQAIDYLHANTPMAELEITTEVDRYIVHPGQALGYMVGRLEIQRIRGAAAQQLGDRFDIRAFHDTVLGHGALPLSLLAEIVEEWAAATA